MISVLIPVRNGGEDLRRCLEAIGSQQVEDEVEVVVVDSASTDGSAELAERMGARVHRIRVEEFNHGSTRNLAAELAKGDTLVFTSQDAYAADEHWLAELTAPLADPEVGGAYGRQVAHSEARPPEVYFMNFLYGRDARVQEASGPAELSMDNVLFSNVTSAIPRRVFERFPFVDDIVMTEDQEWSRRVLLAGYRIAYVADAVVHHSHPYTVRQAFKRFFDSGASAERAFMPAGGAGQRAVRRNAVAYGRGELAWMWRNGHRRWIPYAIVYEGAKFAGLQLGARHERLPRGLKRRLSAQPTYWDD